MNATPSRLLVLLLSPHAQSVAALASASHQRPIEALRQLTRLIDQGFVIATSAAGVTAYQLAPQSPEPDVSHLARRVLLLEADQAIRDLTVAILEAEGYAVIATGIEADATALVSDVGFDLVIADVHRNTSAPALVGGADLIAAAGITPVALFTAHKVALDAALAAGFRDLIAKPFDLSQFEHQIRELLVAGQAKRAGSSASGGGHMPLLPGSRSWCRRRAVTILLVAERGGRRPPFH